MISIVNSIIGKLGLTGCLVAIDSTPAFTIKFDFPCGQWKKIKSPEWEYVGNPGGRLKYPIYAGMSEEKITFNTFHDLTNRNGQPYLETITTNLGTVSPYKGLNDVMVSTMQMSNMDYISHIKAVYNKFITPKVMPGKTLMSAAGSVLKTSQGQSDPTPPLTLLVKNSSEAYIGYVTKAEVTESNFNSFNYPTRILVDVEFAVVPDSILQSMKDVLEDIHAIKSLGGL